MDTLGIPLSLEDTNVAQEWVLKELNSQGLFNIIEFQDSYLVLEKMSEDPIQ